MGIYPVSEEKLLIYGVGEYRSAKKSFCIFDLRTHEFLEADSNLMEDLRKKSMKNPQLSKIFG